MTFLGRAILSIRFVLKKNVGFKMKKQKKKLMN